MKAPRTVFRAGRHEQRMQDTQDSYRATAHMPDPARCPRCGAAYLKGRWTWQAVDSKAAEHTCPACQRIEDNFPAGYVVLKGAYFAQHREEILNVVNARATHARDEHPLQRIIGMEKVDGGVRVTTTDAHLARGIAIAVQEAFKGDLDLTFTKDENLVRATWSR